MIPTIQPQHINATADDLAGNQGRGRYLLLTGSDERAKIISEQFDQVKTLPHPRQHNLYLGTINALDGTTIDVGVISIGMGGASADIILSELIFLGAKRLLRIGTSASLQAPAIAIGELVVATSAVRDDKSSCDYIYQEYPAVASYDYLTASLRAVKEHHFTAHFGIVHSKSSLYAREFDFSLIDSNHYMDSLEKAGVVATEMECAQLFILSSLATARQQHQQQANPDVLAGAVLAIIGDQHTPYVDDKQLIEKTINDAIRLGFETIRQLDQMEKNQETLLALSNKRLNKG